MSKKKYVGARSVSKVVEPVDSGLLAELRQLAAGAFASPPSGEALAELSNRVDGLPLALASRFLISLAQEEAEKAAPFLERQAQSPNAPLALAAVEALGGVPSSRTAEFLSRLATTDPNRELRKEAKRALFRLRSLGVAVATPVARMEEERPAYPILHSIISTFDGTGTRAMVVGVKRPLGGADRILVLINMRRGMIDCVGVDTSQKALSADIDRLLNRPERGVLWAEAPAPYCQHLAQDAFSLNRKSGTRVPNGYLIWKDEIGQPTEHYDRPLVYRELSALEVKWDPTLLEQSGQLLERHEFETWAFDLAKAREYYGEMEQQKRSLVALPGWSQRERQDLLMRRFFDEVMTPDEHARYKRQLEETAYIFLRHDRILDAKRSLAAAIAMDDHQKGDVVNIPFVRELLRKSFALIERELRGEGSISPQDLGIITLDDLMRP